MNRAASSEIVSIQAWEAMPADACSWKEELRGRRMREAKVGGTRHSRGIRERRFRLEPPLSPLSGFG